MCTPYESLNMHALISHYICTHYSCTPTSSHCTQRTPLSVTAVVRLDESLPRFDLFRFLSHLLVSSLLSFYIPETLCDVNTHAALPLSFSIPSSLRYVNTHSSAAMFSSSSQRHTFRPTAAGAHELFERSLVDACLKGPPH